MKKFSLLIIVIASFITLDVRAGIEHTPYAVPGNLHIYDNGGNTFVDLIAHGCSAHRYYISPSHPKYNAIISIILSAQMAGRKVSFRFDDCNSQSQGLIIGVYIQ